MSLLGHRTCIGTAISLAMCFAGVSCSSKCGPPPSPETGTYHITSAPDPDLVGGTITITADHLVIEYMRDGVLFTVTYRMGHRVV